MAFTELCCRLFGTATTIQSVSFAIVAPRAEAASNMSRLCGTAFDTRHVAMFTPSDNRVKEAMFGCVGHAKVFNSIVGLVLVFVVNMLITGKLSPQILGHYQPVLKHICAAMPYHDVTTGMNLTPSGPRMVICSQHASLIGDNSAFTRTESPMFRSALCCGKLNTTLLTRFSHVSCSRRDEHFGTITAATIRAFSKVVTSYNTFVSALATANKSRFASDTIMEGNYCQSSKNTPGVIFSFCHNTHCTSVGWRHNGVY